jgi:hypothetical protein
VVAEKPPGDDVTVNPVIALPFALGAVQLTMAFPSPATALTPVGAPGSPIGMTMLEGAEAGPVPNTLVALTVKV